MTEYYIEMFEDNGEENYKPQPMQREYVENEASAEKIYNDNKDKYDSKTLRAYFIEMNHNINPQLNEPCIKRKITNGKVEAK